MANPKWTKGTSGNPSGRPRKDAAPRSDGWANVLTGLGTANRDKSYYDTFYGSQYTSQYLEEVWRGSDMAARIIELPVREMLRRGFEIEMGKEAHEIGEAINGKLEDIGLSQALERAMMLCRAKGGGVILLGANDGATDLAQPLSLDTVRSLDWITVLEPQEVAPHAYYANPAAPRFGDVAVYMVSASAPGNAVDGQPRHINVYVHESRIIAFDGIRTSRRTGGTSNPNGWGDSILVRCLEAIQNLDMGHKSAAILMRDFAQAVFKMRGLADAIAADNGDVIKNRAIAMELSRSTARALIIDESEEFERKQTPLTGLVELLEQCATRVSASCGIPLSLLMGQAPAGLNATGDSDIRYFYDSIASEQKRTLTPAIERVVKILFAVSGIDEPDSWSVCFPPLWQPTEKEQAETRHIQSQVDQIYLATGVLSPDEVARSRFEGEDFSYKTVIDFDSREDLTTIGGPNDPNLEAEATSDQEQSPITNPKNEMTGQ